MKSNNDYTMFLTGYLEALTDIDGDMREFGASVKVFDSNHSDHINDIKRVFGFDIDFKIVSHKKYRNFYSIERILSDLIFLKPFGDAKIAKKDIEYFKQYTIFHLLDYVDFAFDDATYRLGGKKKFELLSVLGKKSNYIFLIASAEGKKLIMRFYRNKKYFTNKAFISWTKEIIQNQKDKYIADTKEHYEKYGLSQKKIDNFLYQRYNAKNIVYLSYELLYCLGAESNAINTICSDDDLKLEELIPLFKQGLKDMDMFTLDNIQDTARWLVLQHFFDAGRIEDFRLQKRFDGAIVAIDEFNKKFQTKDKLKQFRNYGKYGDAISSNIHDILIEIKNILEYSSDNKMQEQMLKELYKKDTLKDIWIEIGDKIKSNKKFEDLS